MSYKKTLIFVIAVSIIFIGLDVTYIILDKKNSNGGDNPPIVKPSKKLPKLPKPEVTGGERGKLGIDKNINESTIDKYLGREDSVYRDMRMLEDPANYEAIGGDSYLSGYVKGFEVVPLPYIFEVTGLPDEVGYTYSGDTLFLTKSDGTYVANYKESMDIIEELFPRNKYIFLMCGGGGYAGMMKNFLVSLGYDKDRIYVVGGYWYYEGKNNVVVKHKEKDKITYDFESVPYHDFKFEELTPNKYVPDAGKPISLTKKYYNSTKNDGYESKPAEYQKKINAYYDEISKLYDDYDKNKDKINEIDIKIDNLYEEIKEFKANYINDIVDDKESFVLYTYIPSECGDDEETVRYRAQDLAKKYKIYFYDVPFEVFKKTSLYGDVKYGPSVIVVNKGKVYAYTDAESDEDLELGKSNEKFEKWFKKYVNLK